MANVSKRIGKTGEVSYLIRVFVHQGADGKQATKSMTWKPPEGMAAAKADKQAEKEAVLFEQKVRTGIVTLDGNIKFADYAAKWLEMSELRPKTVEIYTYLLRSINQAIGHIPLEKLRVEHIQLYMKNLREDGLNKRSTCVAKDEFKAKFSHANKRKNRGTTRKEVGNAAGLHPVTVGQAVCGHAIERATAVKMCEAMGENLEDMFHCTTTKLSDATIKKHYKLIKIILAGAKKSHIVANNVAEYMDAPKETRKEARYLDDEQAQAFLEALMNEPDIRIKTALTVFLFTGIRRGELCGLSWTDIDYKNKIISICRQSQYMKGRGSVECETKTYGSIRDITVSPFVLDVLKKYHKWWAEYRFKCGDTWQGDKERLFIATDGSPIHPTIINDWLSRFIKKNNLPSISPHSLRHTFITLQVNAGVDIRTLQARTGHATATTLLNVYSHAIQSAQENAAAAMDEMLIPIGKSTKRLS